jgi:hypothetical protein
MSLETAINESIEKKDIGLILSALLDAQLYAVCMEENGETVIWFVQSLENKNIAVVTVSERLDWLEKVMADNTVRSKMIFKPVAGEEIAVMCVNNNVEVYIQFEDRAFKIPRSYFEEWAKAATSA